MGYSYTKKEGREYAAHLSRKLNLQISFVEMSQLGITLQVTRWKTYKVIHENGNFTDSIISDQWMACSLPLYSVANILFDDMKNESAEYMLKNGYTRIDEEFFKLET